MSRRRQPDILQKQQRLPARRRGLLHRARQPQSGPDEAVVQMSVHADKDVVEDRHTREQTDVLKGPHQTEFDEVV